MNILYPAGKAMEITARLLLIISLWVLLVSSECLFIGSREQNHFKFCNEAVDQQVSKSCRSKWIARKRRGKERNMANISVKRNILEHRNFLC